MNEKETTDKLKVCIQNLNAILEECRKKDISIAIGVEYPDKMMSETIYLHKDNKTSFNLKEVYGK